MHAISGNGGGGDVDAAKSRYRCRRACRRVETRRRILIRDLQISRAAKRRATRRGVARRAIRRINWSMRESERERERAVHRGSRVPDGRERSIRETKCRPYTFLYVPIRRAIQLRWTSHTGICNILREQSSSRDRQCMRSHGYQWHLHLYWHGAQWDLEQRRMLKCICDRGLTTGPEFFRCRIGARTRGKWYARGCADNAGNVPQLMPERGFDAIKFSHCGHADIAHVPRVTSALTLARYLFGKLYIWRKLTFFFSPFAYLHAH